MSRKRGAIRTYSTTPPVNEAQEAASACAICGEGRARLQWQSDAYRFVRCVRCGHLYQNPRPTVAALDDRYAEEYCQYELENAEPFLELMLRGIDDSGVMSALASAAAPQRLLDIGCATGMLLAHYQAEGWQTEGIELCAPAAEYARATRGVTVTTGDYRAATLPEHHYGLVHSSHVIEHVGDPLNFLRYIARVLHREGYAIIVTPDAASMQAALMGARWRSIIADHLQLFRARNLTALAERAHLRVVKKCSWGGLAAGSAARPLKYLCDRLAKTLNIGDVMLLLLRHRV